ncbi:MAG: T9SS type A sorting domain-containing protein [Bacteroidota bacterium]|nr:T9SS type A sorting domain-containing protein [Bacteroidota bacterium]
MGINKQTASITYFSVYPNPANSTVTVSYNLSAPGIDGVFIIRDVNGSEVKREPAKANGSEKTINTASLANGMYFISLEQGNKRLGDLKLVINR